MALSPEERERRRAARAEAQREAIHEAARKVVATAPPLSAETVDRVARMLDAWGYLKAPERDEPERYTFTMET